MLHSYHRKPIVLALAVLAGALVSMPVPAKTGAARPAPPHSFVPSAGFVPNKGTAVRIAVAVWVPIYGEKQIQGERPYNATLKKGVWTVTGSLPKGWVGGVALAEISKRDGRILRVSHGK
jgi:hypothetical protein